MFPFLVLLLPTIGCGGDGAILPAATAPAAAPPPSAPVSAAPQPPAAEGDTAWSIALDGAATPLVGLGDASSGTAGVVTGVRSAWVTEGGDSVVHLDTGDPARPDVLVRLGEDAAVDVLAALEDATLGALILVR